ncbi:MAG: hypothetical protein V4721_04450 [Bacteroidota bacterium]
MKTFVIKEDGINSMMKDLYIRGSLAATAIFIFLFAMTYFRPNRNLDETGIIILIIIFASITTWFFSIAIAKTRRLFESFSLTFDGNLITRDQYDTPTITLLRTEITEIIKYKKGSFKIKGGSKYDVILVPKQIAEGHQLEELLKQIVPVVEKEREISILQSLTMIGVVIAFFALYETTKNKFVVFTCGAILILATIFHLLNTHKSKNIDYSSKRNVWLTILTLISIGLGIYRRLSN